MLIHLLSERASFCQSCLSSRRFTEMNIAAGTSDDCLRVGKDGGNLKASGALDIHKVGIGSLYQSLQFVRAGKVFFGRV